MRSGRISEKTFNIRLRIRQGAVSRLSYVIFARIAQWYSAGPRAGRSGDRVPAWAGNFSLHLHVQTGFRAHSASYKTVTRGSFPGGKVARA
jgi:hypothetical protein